MANVKVKALVNHYIGRARRKGDVYLLPSEKLAFLVKQGYVSKVSKKKKDEATD